MNRSTHILVRHGRPCLKTTQSANTLSVNTHIQVLEVPARVRYYVAHLEHQRAIFAACTRNRPGT